MWSGGSIGGYGIAGLAPRFRDTEPDPFLGLAFGQASEQKSFLLIAQPFDPNNYNLLLASDDPTDSAWVASGVTPSTGVSDPNGGTDAWSIQTDNLVDNEYIQQRIDSNTGALQGHQIPATRLFLQAGNVDAISADCYVTIRGGGGTSLSIASVKRIDGPGSVSIVQVGGQDWAFVESLSDSQWTELEIVHSDLFTVGAASNIRIVPGDPLSTVSAVTNVFRPQVQADDTLIRGHTTPVRATTSEKNGPGGAPGEVVTVYLSNNGYRSHPTDDPADTFFEDVLKAPYNAEVNILSTNRVAVRSSPTFGEIVMLNPRAPQPDGAHEGFFDKDLIGYSWGGRQLETYFGDKPDPLINFTKIFQGSGSALAWTTDEIRLSIKDRVEEIDIPLQRESYEGRHFALRFASDTTDTEVTFGDNFDVGAGDSLWGAIWYRMPPNVTPGVARIIYSKQAGLTSQGYRVQLTDGNVARFVIRDGSSNEALVTGGTDLSDGDWHRIAWELHRDDDFIRIYVDGSEDAAEVDASSVGGLANATDAKLGIIATSGPLDGDLDEFEIKVSASATDIAAIRDDHVTDRHDRRLYDFEITNDYDSVYKMDEGTGTTLTDSNGGPSGTITLGTSGEWIGSGEGIPDLGEKFKPESLGKVRQVEATLIDTADSVYQVHSNSAQDITAVRDNGDALSDGGDVGANDDLYSSADPSAGDFKTDLKAGMFRLGSAAVGVITADVEGDDAGSLGYKSDAAGLVRKIVVDHGGLTDPGDIDVNAFSDLEVARPDVIGFFAGNDEVRIPDALDDIMLSVGGYWGFKRNGLLTVGLLEVPDTSDVAFTFEDGDIFIDEIESLPQTKPTWKLRLGYRKFWRVLNESEIAGAVSGDDADSFEKEFREVRAKDDSILTTHANAEDDDADTLLDDQEDAKTEADRRLTMFGSLRSLYRVPIKNGLFTYDVGDTVELKITRFGLEDGKAFRVVGFREDLSVGGIPDIQLVLWG